MRDPECTCPHPAVGLNVARDIACPVHGEPQSPVTDRPQPVECLHTYVTPSADGRMGWCVECGAPTTL